MKKTISVTVDLDNLLIAKQKLGDRELSAYVNDCLAGLSEFNSKDRSSDKLRKDMDLLDKQLNELSVRKSILGVELSKAQQVEADNIIRLEREEDCKRWVCQVCDRRKIVSLNLMSDIRCKECNLPVRDNKNTIIKIIEPTKNKGE